MLQYPDWCVNFQSKWVNQLRPKLAVTVFYLTSSRVQSLWFDFDLFCYSDKLSMLKMVHFDGVKNGNKGITKSDTGFNSIQPNVSAVCLCVVVYSPVFVRDSAVLLKKTRWIQSKFSSERNTETHLDCSSTSVSGNASIFFFISQLLLLSVQRYDFIAVL